MRRPAPGAKAPAARARQARRRRVRAHAGQRRSLLRRGSTRCPCCPSARWMRRQSPCVRATAAARTPRARAPARRTLLPHTPHVTTIRAWHTRLSVCHVGFRVKPGARTRQPRASTDQVHKPGIGSANSTLRTVSDVTHGSFRVSRPFPCETRGPDATAPPATNLSRRRLRLRRGARQTAPRTAGRTPPGRRAAAREFPVQRCVPPPSPR